MTVDLSKIKPASRPRKRDYDKALRALMYAVEADHKCQGIDPRSVLMAHTYVALAMKDADDLLERDQ